MTLQKDQPKQPSTRLQKIVWTVTLTIAGACVIAAIVLAIIFHINIFG
ncbi:MAG TPA: hypothetical protein VHZ98_03965 [Galbitalea sp.]|jgi:hypothetical protein|nr:hypothetical protein [Galbitalea sp.]